MTTDTLNLPPTDEVMALVAKYGRSEYNDGGHNTDETLEAKEALFSQVTVAVRAYATAAVLAERRRWMIDREDVRIAGYMKGVEDERQRCAKPPRSPNDR